jgi:menaquinol-cytochrome c reductase iron-sulfur subunit
MNTDPNENDSKEQPEPVRREQSHDKDLDRRFFTKLSLALVGFATFLVGIPVVGFLIDPLFRPAPRLWRQVGAVDDFKIGDVSEVSFEDTSALPWAGLTNKTAAWLYRQGEQEFVAYSVNCAHLGCPVRWEADAQLFMCPCHGGVYFKDGNVAAGPPPRGLTKYPVRVQNGQVEILTSPAPIT